MVENGVNHQFTSRVRYHCPMFAYFKFLKRKQNTYQRTIWNYRTADYDQLRGILTQTDWSILHGNLSVNEQSHYITSSLKAACSESIPHKTATLRPTRLSLDDWTHTYTDSAT